MRFMRLQPSRFLSIFLSQCTNSIQQIGYSYARNVMHRRKHIKEVNNATLKGTSGSQL